MRLLFEFVAAMAVVMIVVDVGRCRFGDDGGVSSCFFLFFFCNADWLRLALTVIV